MSEIIAEVDVKKKDHITVQFFRNTENIQTVQLYPRDKGYKLLLLKVE